MQLSENVPKGKGYALLCSFLLPAAQNADMMAGPQTAILEHEASTSKISEEQLFYCRQRGISQESAIGLIVNGYAKDVLTRLPMEFAVEAQKLLSLSIENGVG